MENRAQTFRYLIAGPCAVESEHQVYETAYRLHVQQAQFPFPLTYFRAGVWKPRSNATAFTGAGDAAFPWLHRITHDFGFPVCVEVATPQHVETCLKHGIHTFWIGARTAVNPFSIQELATSVKNIPVTILLKNPIIPDLKLWIGNLERFEKAGVKEILAVHRGFADTNESLYRNAPLWELPSNLRIARPDLPIICDPSHIAGNRMYIKQIAQTAIDYGINGLMIETHYAPENALSDSQQQLTPAELSLLLAELQFTQTNNHSENLLRQQRQQIQHIDEQIAQLLAKRLRVVEEIAQVKRDNHIPLVQPAQWNNVVKIYEKHSIQNPYYQEFIDKYLELLHQYSLKIQQQ